MKLPNNIIRLFEDDQKTYGTKVALYNILWLNASELLSDLGVTSLKTVHKDGSGRKGDRTKAINFSLRRKKKGLTDA